MLRNLLDLWVWLRIRLRTNSYTRVVLKVTYGDLIVYQMGEHCIGVRLVFFLKEYALFSDQK